MADNYLEDKFEEYQKKKAALEKARKAKKPAKPTPHIKPQFYQEDIREEVEDDH